MNEYYVDPSTTGDYNAVVDSGFAVPSGEIDDTGYLAGDATLSGGERLTNGSSLRAGTYRLLMQSDGNLVLYNARNEPLWASNTNGHPGAYAIMQGDGNFVVYSPSNSALWAAGAQGRTGARVTMQNDGNLVVLDPRTGATFWDSGTWGGVKSGSHDSHGILGSIGSAVSSVGHALGGAVGAITNNPLWDVVKTGVSFIPGVGTAVSAGMAGAAAIGRGESLANIGLAAARGALPGGAITQAAFDVASGLAKGTNVTDAILQAARSQVPGGAAGQAAFDAATAIAKGHALSDVALQMYQRNLPGGAAARQVFDAAIASYRAKSPAAIAVPSYPVLSQTANAAARAIHASPVLQRTAAREVASDLKTDVANVQRAIAAIMNRLGGSQMFTAGDVGAIDSLEDCCAREGVPSMSNTMGYDTGAYQEVFGRTARVHVPVSHVYLQAMMRRGQQPVRAAILAHGMIPRLFHNTGELDGAGGWIIRSGDTGSGVAQKVTGNANRWKELLAANPGMSTFTAANGSTQIKPWNIGQRVTLPASWLGTAVAVPNPATPAAPSSPVVTPVSTSFPPSSQAATLPTIKKGSSGSAVTMWQALLLKLGSQIVGSADGQFGPLTDTATRAYQLRMGLTVDGVVGPMTWGAGLRELEGKAAAPAPVPAAPPVISVPSIGPAVPSSSNVPQLAAVQAGLAGFYLHHAGEVTVGDFASASTAPFGSTPDDLTGSWTGRSSAAMQGFQNWWNRQPGNAHLPEDGQPDQASVNALITQTTKDLRAVGENIPLPNLPTTPVVNLPGSGIPAPRPPAPAPPKPVQASVAGSSSDGDGDGVVAVAIGIAILAALASQKGSRRAA